MKREEFEFLLQQGEGLKLELKENFDPKNIAKEMVAFANTEGGRIFIGITDDGKVKGISISNKLKAEIMDVARNCDPRVYIDFDQFENVFIVNVEEGFNKPCCCSLVELVEKTGSRIERMKNAMKEVGLPEPEIEFTSFFTIRFKRPVLMSKEQKTVEKTTQKIIELIKENPFITRKELAEKLNISEKEVKYHLKILKEKNKIKRIGPDKGGHWEVME